MHSTCRCDGHKHIFSRSLRLINGSRKCKVASRQQQQTKKSLGAGWRLYLPYTPSRSPTEGFYVRIMFMPNEPTSSLTIREVNTRKWALQAILYVRLYKSDMKAVRRLSMVTFWRLAPVVFSRKHFKHRESEKKKFTFKCSLCESTF